MSQCRSEDNSDPVEAGDGGQRRPLPASHQGLAQSTRPGWDTDTLMNYLTEGTVNDSAVTTSIPDYVSVHGLDLQTCQVHARCILLDTKTGYRSQFLAVSGIVSL